MPPTSSLRPESTAEVIDLRVLRPLDNATIIESVRKTHRAVVVDEGWRTGSLAAEISARIIEQAFFDLDAPVARVCSAEVPIPYAKHLEQAALAATGEDRRRGQRPLRCAHMIDFMMPSLGADMDEGTLDRVAGQARRPVSRGQVVAVVDTTKAAVEVECWHDGTVQELLVPVGETVEVGTPLARLLESGETALPPKSRRPRSRRRQRRPRASAPAPPSPRWVSPAARRVRGRRSASTWRPSTGTGPQGAVTINDVEHAAAADITPAAATSRGAPTAPQRCAGPSRPR